MTKLIDELAPELLKTRDPSAFPRVIAVRGIVRGVGATSIAANLALLLAQRQENVLMLDLSLWNYDLSRAFGHTPNSELGSMAQQFYETDSMPLETLQRHVRHCRQNLELLPSGEHWLDMAALRAENGWNVIGALLTAAKARWSVIVADLGSDRRNKIEPTDYIFTASCAVHAAMLYASTTVTSVCDSMEYLKMWQQQWVRNSYLQSKEKFIVNKYRREMPLGFDKYAVDEKLRSQSHFLPQLKTALLANTDRLFLVERGTVSSHLSREEEICLRRLAGIADLLCRKS